MMKKALYSFGVLAVGSFLNAQASLAQVFPVDTASTTTITSVKADIVAWGVVLISIALTLLALHRVMRVVK